ncbi:hypothetical protein [Deinococcus arenicola]|uniref:YqaE/Pmp3 family membrane protein n=1 Tax=Deinococcus arenicola TaxID=2994950 RepID=A0ABU4DRG1_9DEIO|nr:hypothetical protein [Deinococcus sp. ZS9-10]MDV6374450.1 hypothetical protein [Deinococcus sp. ZS9-10]
MNRTITFWGPILLALPLARTDLLSQNHGWDWAGWLTAAAVLLPILEGVVWAFDKKDPEKVSS